MFRKEVFPWSGACSLLLFLFAWQAFSIPLLQTNASESEPEEAETSVDGLPIRFVKTTLQTHAIYTEEARLGGVEGTAVVYAEIAQDGCPENLRMLRRLGYGLDQEAIRAVQQWRFEPSLQNGQAIRVATYVLVRFRLDRQIYDAQLPGASGGKEIFQIAEGGITVPRILSRVAPTYTEEAKVTKVQGTVVLFAEITSAGIVENVVVLHKLGKGLDESAVSAIKQWKFSPALKDGRPVAVMMTIQMNFNLV